MRPEGRGGREEEREGGEGRKGGAGEMLHLKSKGWEEWALGDELDEAFFLELTG